ncbi:MAG: peptidase M20 [Bellilinea sp.]|nr:MAG: peptidase M20 [Bellilinea sp.]
MNNVSQFVEKAESLYSYSQYLRRDFHRYPELGFQEYRTAEIIARELRSLGLEVTTGIAETGVTAIIEGAHPGRVVMLRFDMDALPIEEQTGADYASQHPGVMHACGHDGHMAIGLTVARLLQQNRGAIHGTIKLVFQPAEEGLGGAERMVAERVLENPRVDVCLGLHLWNEKPLGWAAVVPGAFMAGADFFTVRILGKGGHGGLPETTIDPIVAAAQVVMALQTIVSRNIAPLESAVVSVTQMAAGSAYNVIPNQAELRGTIRTFMPEVRDVVLARLEQIIHSIARGMNCEAKIDLQRLTWPVVNHPRVAEIVQEVIKNLLPEYRNESNYRSMVSEDMAVFLNQVPGCFFFIGSGNPEKGLNASHHHPKFDFDEQVLPKAAAILAAAAIELGKSGIEIS